MELSFAFNALKRYWWLALIFVFLGTFGGYLISRRHPITYRSSALVLVQPAGSSGVGTDRFVASQMVTIGSESNAVAAVRRLDGRITTDELRQSLTIQQVPLSDVVEVSADDPTPAGAQRKAQAVVDAYLQTVTQGAVQTDQERLKPIKDQIQKVNDQLSSVDSEIATRMAAYLQKTSAPGNQAIPMVEQLFPNLVSQQATLRQQLESLNDSRLQLELGAPVAVNSRLVQAAVAPRQPQVFSRKKPLAEGVLAGAFIGIVACAVRARLSRWVLDEAEVGGILDTPVLGEFNARQHSSVAQAVDEPQLSRGSRSLVDLVRVRVDQETRRHRSLIVAVGGTARGSTELALAGALANRFAEGGSTTVLVDAHPTNGELADAFRTMSSNGAARNGLPLRATAIDKLQVAAATDLTGTMATRRRDADAVIERLDGVVDIVVVRCGEILGSAAAVHFAETADSLVLAVPLGNQPKRELANVADAIAGQPDVTTVAVVTPAPDRPLRRRVRSRR